MALAIYAGDDREVCHDTRSWLRRSRSALKAGYLIEAAGLLQQGVRVFLEADLAYWDVRPANRSLVEMAKAILLSGHATRDSYAVLVEAIAYTNSVIRCEVTSGDVAGFLNSQIRIMESFCDGTVYLDERSQA